MTTGKLRLVLVLLPLLVSVHSEAQPSSQTVALDTLILSGTVTNPQGEGINDAELNFTLDGKPLELPQKTVTDTGGKFEIELKVPAGALGEKGLRVQVERRSYRSTRYVEIARMFEEGIDGDGGHHYIAHYSVTLSRILSPAFWIAALVLLAVYIVIAFELLHRTLAAMVGASVLLFVSYTAGTFDAGFRILTFEDAMRAIDNNVIFLLMAMMIIVGVLKRTGVFQWFAYKSFQLTRGNVYALSVLLMFGTALTSAFLDNVTTMLLIIPVTIEIAVALKVSPASLLLPEIFASNVGGTATLIGDPPNIMIGSYAGLSFLQFVEHLALICLICLVFTSAYFLIVYRREYSEARVSDTQTMIAQLRDEYRIRDMTLLMKSGVVLLLTVILFLFHGTLEMRPSIAAMAGASVLLVISGVHIVEMVEQEIEWPTLIFFMMLFIIVAGAEETGLIQLIADWVLALSVTSPVIAILLVLWASALFSAIIDNIPFTATMLPIVAYLTTSISGIESGVLWWALALGACLGGNGTLIGASANVVTAGVAEKAGYPISFMGYMRVALPPMLITVALGMLWLLLIEM